MCIQVHRALIVHFRTMLLQLCSRPATTWPMTWHPEQEHSDCYEKSDQSRPQRDDQERARQGRQVGDEERVRPIGCIKISCTSEGLSSVDNHRRCARRRLTRRESRPRSGDLRWMSFLSVSYQGLIRQAHEGRLSSLYSINTRTQDFVKDRNLRTLGI